MKRKRYSPAKERTLSQVHKKLQELDVKRQILLEVNREWFSRCPESVLGDVTINPDGKPPFKRRVILRLDHDEHAISTDYVEKGKASFYFALRDSELPLYINDETLGDYEKKIIEDRFKGDLFEIPFRQDIVDEHEKISRRFSLLWSLTSGYKKILIRYVRKLMDKKPSKRYTDPKELILLEVEGYTYYFQHERGGYSIKPIDPNSIVTYVGGPDDETI